MKKCPVCGEECVAEFQKFGDHDAEGARVTPWMCANCDWEEEDFEDQ